MSNIRVFTMQPSWTDCCWMSMTNHICFIRCLRNNLLHIITSNIQNFLAKPVSSFPGRLSYYLSTVMIVPVSCSLRLCNLTEAISICSKPILMFLQMASTL